MHDYCLVFLNIFFMNLHFYCWNFHRLVLSLQLFIYAIIFFLLFIFLILHNNQSQKKNAWNKSFVPVFKNKFQLANLHFLRGAQIAQSPLIYNRTGEGIDQRYIMMRAHFVLQSNVLLFNWFICLQTRLFLYITVFSYIRTQFIWKTYINDWTVACLRMK